MTNFDSNKLNDDVLEAVAGGGGLDDIARQVLAGQWGNGQERINRLTAAGKTLTCFRHCRRLLQCALASGRNIGNSNQYNQLFCIAVLLPLSNGPGWFRVRKCVRS